MDYTELREHSFWKSESVVPIFLKWKSTYFQLQCIGMEAASSDRELTVPTVVECHFGSHWSSRSVLCQSKILFMTLEAYQMNSNANRNLGNSVCLLNSSCKIIESVLMKYLCLLPSEAENYIETVVFLIIYTVQIT